MDLIKISKENNVYFYDMENDAKNYYEQKKIYYCDDVHPNDEGAKVISKLILLYLKEKFNIFIE
jgi:hypothetical protein